MATLVGQPQQDAERLLEAAWIKDGHLRLPVDPFAISQRLGIKVFTAALDEGVAGLLRKRPWHDPEIHVNASDSRNRQRFTCAHELGHFRRRTTDTDQDEWEYVDHRDTAATLGEDPDEVYANRFAANLLMPVAAIRKLLARYGDDPTALASEFGVSRSAMSNRLESLRKQHVL